MMKQHRRMTGWRSFLGTSLAAVAVLGHQAATDLFPGVDPIGQLIKVNHVWLEVVGVLGDRRYGIADPEIAELVSSAQGKRRWRSLVTMSARYDGALRDIGLGDGVTPPPVVIETADGTTLRSDDADAPP